MMGSHRFRRPRAVALTMTALFLSTVLPSVAQRPALTDQGSPQPHHHFSQFPTAPDADPSITHEEEFVVPTGLAVRRTGTGIAVRLDRAPLQTIRVPVGKSMSVGIKTELRIYPVGTSRPEKPYETGYEGGLLARPGSTSAFKGEQNVGHEPGGDKLRPGTKYVVEESIAIFQTALPPQHLWMPEGKYYKVLWKSLFTDTASDKQVPH